MMYIAHAFAPDGSLAYTRGGFSVQSEAETAAVKAHRSYGGGWKVVEAIPYHWHAWAVGDHSIPVQGRTVAFGGLKEAAASPALR